MTPEEWTGERRLAGVLCSILGIAVLVYCLAQQFRHPAMAEVQAVREYWPEWLVAAGCLVLSFLLMRKK
jgi:protein-S-isoprenylcysteine O-methyltransferase Ste14